MVLKANRPAGSSSGAIAAEAAAPSTQQVARVTAAAAQGRDFAAIWLSTARRLGLLACRPEPEDGRSWCPGSPYKGSPVLHLRAGRPDGSGGQPEAALTATA